MFNENEFNKNSMSKLNKFYENISNYIVDSDEDFQVVRNSFRREAYLIDKKLLNLSIQILQEKNLTESEKKNYEELLDCVGKENYPFYDNIIGLDIDSNDERKGILQSIPMDDFNFIPSSYNPNIFYEKVIPLYARIPVPESIISKKGIEFPIGKFVTPLQSKGTYKDNILIPYMPGKEKEYMVQNVFNLTSNLFDCWMFESNVEQNRFQHCDSNGIFEDDYLKELFDQDVEYDENSSYLE